MCLTTLLLSSNRIKLFRMCLCVIFIQLIYSSFTTWVSIVSSLSLSSFLCILSNYFFTHWFTLCVRVCCGKQKKFLLFFCWLIFSLSLSLRTAFPLPLLLLTLVGVGWLVGWLVRVVCVGCMLYVVINKNSMQLSSSARMYMHREHDGGVRFRLLKRELLASGVWVNTRTCTYHNLFWVVVMVVSISCRDVCNSITNNINKFQFYGTCNGRIKTTCLLAMDIFRLPPSTTTM